jgi:DNA polymerase-3 subunit epsilon
MLKLTRPAVVLDIEATGPEPETDRIVEIGVVVIEPDGGRREWTQRFNPGMPIPQEATDIHGITDADVADCPPFSKWATRIRAALLNRDLIGYNLWRFDLVILDEELRRCGFSLNMDGIAVIDVCNIFMKKEPRDLTAAVKKFCDYDHESAHSAVADASATLDVLNGQLAHYPDLAEMDLETLAAFSRRDEDKKLADLAGKLFYDKNGDLRYNIRNKGKKDVLVWDDPGFGYWMLRSNFPESTKEFLNQFLNGGGKKDEA